jgi:tRNA-dihydrouridine synthase B
MNIGFYALADPIVLAPMAGITDRPFRELCKQFGAGLAVSEMIASNPDLRTHKRTLLKADHSDETGLCSAQIIGTDPKHMAEAARFNVERGAAIIDINMGCPAKKVCAVAAGSALLKDEALVKRILDAVIAAVAVPVTLKMRTGWDAHNRNAVTIARIAAQAGIAALAVHGRTRACKFEGEAEYETIRQIKQAVSIPVMANGDIDTPEQALAVLALTQADAVMIGRGAQGNPWLFSQIRHFLKTGKRLAKPSLKAIHQVLLEHLDKLYGFYGKNSGVRIARKHVGWYFEHLKGIDPVKRSLINNASEPAQQIALINSVFTEYAYGL